MQDPWARHRELLADALQGAIAAIPFAHADLVREQVAASPPASYDMAALACLRAVEATGAPAEAALPPATALQLMAQMGLVFAGLESQNGSASLSTAWGMPRSLNAGDAFFAAAQDAILAETEELTPESRLVAVRLLDDAARDYLAAISQAAPDEPLAGQTALLPAALSLGALYGGADTATRSQFYERGRAWSQLPTAELARALASDPASWSPGAN